MSICLISGGAGFIGSHVADELLRMGHEVVVLDDLSGGFAENVPKKAFFLKGSVCDAELVNRAFGDFQFDYVFHLAAYAAEGLSHFIKRFNYENNLVSSCAIINACVNHNVKRLVFTSCLDSESRLFTKQGLKRYAEISVGDSILSINTQTGVVEDDVVLETVVNDYDGEMLDFHGKRAHICCTPNHRFLLVRSFDKNPTFAYEPASETFNRAVVRLPSGSWRGEVFPSNKIAFEHQRHHGHQITEMDAGDFFYLVGLFVADGVVAKSVSIRPAKTGLGRDGYLKSKRDNLGRFVAQENQNKTTVCHDNRIRFCVPRKDKARQKLESILNKYGISWYEEMKGDQVVFSCSALRNHFGQCGDNAHSKHIPAHLLDYDYPYLERMWEGLIDGDGHWHSGKYPYFTTTSWQLVLDCLDLGAKLGKSTTFWKSTSRHSIIKGRVVNSSPAYYLNFGTTERTMYKETFKKVQYSGKVWCIRTRNGNFLAERDGRSFFTGNSIAVYGKAQAPMSEDMLPIPEDSYGIAKYAVEQELRISHEMFGLPYTIFRPANVYGENQHIGDRYRNVIGIFMNQCLRGEPLTIFGDGEQQRAFTYIDDVAPIIAHSIEYPACETFNVGADTPYKVNYLAQVVSDAMGVSLNVRHLPARNETVVAYSSHAKEERVFGKREKVSLEVGVGKMAEWVKKVGSREPTRFENIEIEKGLPPSWRTT